MGREDWDLFLVVFGECHGAGHYFWHYQDPEYPAYPADAAAELRSALRDVYTALDRAIGELLRHVDEETTVLLVAGDGMGPNYSGSHVLGPSARPHGAAARRPAGARRRGRDAGATAPGRTRSSEHPSRHDPRSLRATISRTVLPRRVNERLSLRWKTAGIDWQRTRAYLIENANEGYIRINLAGREPQGTVAPGTDYETLCDELRRTAAEMVNPATGEPAAHGAQDR